MADDTATVQELQAELQRLRERDTASRAEIAALQAENATLGQEQTATAEVLRVIASSQADLTPVFDAVAERAYRLCGGSSARIYLVDGDTCRIVGPFTSQIVPPRRFALRIPPQLFGVSRPC